MPIRMINNDLAMIGSLQINFRFKAFTIAMDPTTHLKKIDTQMKAKAADSEMYCGSAQRR